MVLKVKNQALCREEVVNQLDSSSVLLDENKTFSDIVDDDNEAEDIIYDLTDELYNNKQVDYLFQELSEEVMYTVDHKLCELLNKLKKEKND